MDKIKIEGLDEVVFHEKLENGLNIFVLKKDYNTFSHYFITNYGALIDNFVPIGEDKMHKFPKGIAHFLEHKMFEQESGPSVMEKFSSLGGSCNAFTNYLFELGYPKVLIRADVRNIGSNRVIEKCGFTFTHKEFIEHKSSVRPESVTVNWYEIKR